MTQNNVSYYAKALRSELPADAFAPAPLRALWIPLHVAVIVISTYMIWARVGGWPAAIALSLVIGQSFAGLAFVGHELMHGAILRSNRPRYALGWLCFLPFTLSPRLWIAWHNRVHHGHTMAAGVDPDAYPTLEAYQKSRALQVADYVSPASSRWLGIFSLLIGFTVQSSHILLSSTLPRRYLSRRQHIVAGLETGLGLLFWTALAWIMGPLGFLLCFIVPLLLANFVVMAYIFTNHSLSPLTEINDPLLNSLTVTTPRIFSILHLDFGMHVEHHIFPAMSSVHAGLVRGLLQKLWPERYQSMPLSRALWLLFTTPRVYKDAVTLVDPRNGRESSTLLHRLPIPVVQGAEGLAL